MKQFLPYTHHLEGLVRSASPSEAWLRNAAAALDGEPGRELSRLAPLRTRRRDGAFFTGSTLATQAIVAAEDGSINCFDPACGAGDLLLAAARHLPVKAGLVETLKLWGGRLAGRDLHPAFIRATKARLAVLALQRGAKHPEGDALRLDQYFKGICVGDALATDVDYSAGWIVVNPPYGYRTAPEDCSWAQGKVTAAALFLETCLERAAPGTRITAILPEVLRSGSRYEAWRKMVESKASVERVESYGLFDAIADIDVFILDARKTTGGQKKSADWKRFETSATSALSVSDYFDVHVGSVVPHRNKKVGPKTPYIHARSMPPWDTISRVEEYRRFKGTLFAPPFVAIRRTSRPGDKFRATATLVSDGRPLAVENHLVVCAPRSGRLSECEQLLPRLKDQRTNDWLDGRIRCRHLTVSAIRELPWWNLK